VKVYKIREEIKSILVIRWTPFWTLTICVHETKDAL